MGKYSNLSKEQLLKLVEKQEAELKSKKYGLVWDSEREPETVVLECESNLPVLKRIKGKEIRTDAEADNILIEGDNYHALTVLNYTHKEKVDVIYIDPPYNTGNKDFIYNDKYVDKEDGYRHSKWLNFMEKRLNLAKELLKETGVIFISIDDNEVAQLKLLCDKIFGEDNFLAVQIWRGMHTVRNSSKDFNRNTEYVVTYAKNKNVLIKPGNPETYLRISKDKTTDYPHDDRDGNGPYKLDPIYARNFYTPYEIIFPNGKKWSAPRGNYPRYSQDTLLGMYNDGKLVFSGKDPKAKRYLKDVQDGVPPNTLLSSEDVGFNKDGTSLLYGMFNEKEFDQPKPVSLIRYLLSIKNKEIDNKNITILDFMAGSGTTGHAVLDLNKEDGGKRKFILCTNNENGICANVTYPRLEKAIRGYRNSKGEDVAGLGGNLQYFRTDLVRKTKSRDQLRLDLTRKCTEMLCVKENVFNSEIEKEDYKIFSSNDGSRFLCVYYNFLDDSFDDFLADLKRLKGKKHAYVFSMDGSVDAKPFAGMEDLEIEEIPQKILEIYKQLVRMNVPVKPETIFIDLEKAKARIFDSHDKDDGARILRVVLEGVLKRIARDNGIGTLGDGAKEEKVSAINDKLKSEKVLSRVAWEENRTFLAIGNDASHGKYDEYELAQVERFYSHVNSLIESFNIGL